MEGAENRGWDDSCGCREAHTGLHCDLTTDVDIERATWRIYCAVRGCADAEVMRRKRALEGAIVL
jgi:hypothetical protein